jgi:predicted dehydrogenase
MTVAGRPPLRVALVGCGFIGAAHAEAVRRHPGAVLAAAVDPAPEARARAEEAWGCPSFPSVDAMLASAEIDAACVCVPPALHRDISLALFDAGVHVLCEKPLATRLADAKAVVQAARRARRVLMVSSKYRFLDDLGEARRRIARGDIGRPVLYEVTFCARVPAASRWLVTPRLSGGGVLMDNGSHAFDVLAEVLDAPVAAVCATFAPPAVCPAVEDTAEILFVTKGGTPGRLALSWTYFTKDLDVLHVQGTEGGIRVAWTGGFYRRHGEREWRPFGTGYDKTAVFARQLDAFLRWIQDGRPTKELGDPLTNLRLIEAAYRSAREKRWVPVPASRGRRSRAAAEGAASQATHPPGHEERTAAVSRSRPLER